jgi:prohibitin 2
MGFGGLLMLGGAAIFIQNALFNVDGGHRAIKYRRLDGVSKEIYSEGTCRMPRSPSYQLLGRAL